MGIDYKAVGGYGYKFDYEDVARVLSPLLRTKNGDTLCVEEIELFQKGWRVIEGGDYGKNEYVLFVERNNNVHADFTPLKKWLEEIGLDVPKEPKIIIELDIF